MRADPNIFREYDVRGVADPSAGDKSLIADLSPEIAFHLGRAIGTTIVRTGGSSATLGRDCRDSGLWLKNAVAQGLAACGLTVIDCGIVTTPMAYYSIRYFHTDGGVQITGSHNPPEYNGFKISVGDQTIYGEQIQALKKLIESEAYENGDGVICRADVLMPYGTELSENLRLGPRKLKVVVDAGNGTAGPVAPDLYRALGCEVIELFCDMDARFPNHHPDPTVPENLVDLQRAVKKHKADLGIAFDGDADRLGVVDENGGIIWGDALMIILSRAILQRVPGATIVGEVKCSKTLYDDIKKHGGTGIMWKAGHSLIKAKMKETHAELAGEMSGHIFFKNRYYGFDDGVYAGGRLLEILSNTKKPLSSLLADVPKTYSTAELRVDCPESEKFDLVRRAQDHFGRRHDIIDVDGVRVVFPDGWGLIRASNTQPILVLRFEADSPKRLQEIQRYVEGELKALRA